MPMSLVLAPYGRPFSGYYCNCNCNAVTVTATVVIHHLTAPAAAWAVVISETHLHRA